MSIFMPYLWTLLGALLAADPKINYKCEWRSGRAPDLLQKTDSNNIEMLNVHNLNENKD